MDKKISTKILVFITIVLLAGCATENPTPGDPLERYNRGMYAFNKTVDKYAIKPVAEVYNAVLPNPVLKGIGNAFDNITEIPSFINNVLQFRFGNAVITFWRFTINSTIGIGGLFDVATHFGLKEQYQDLGLTFARWGVKSPYFVLPILGPSTISDTVGLAGNYFFTIYPYITTKFIPYGLITLDFIRLRADLLPTDNLVDESFDPYVFVRDAYTQRRAYLLNPEKSEDIENKSGVLPR